MTAYFDSSSMLLSAVFLSGGGIVGLVVHAITSAYWREEVSKLTRLLDVASGELERKRTPINLDGDEQAYKQIRERV